jgi:tRNA threonylcarbamoyl adenosine modification protein (Sua5/YciO/YrdC/YwlC family)
VEVGLLRLQIEPHSTPSPRRIKQAVEILHNGGVAAYPTDSLYALGCALECKRSVERIYRAKRMSPRQKLALICPDLSTASRYAHFSQVAYRLARRIFPGPYTLVVPASREVPRLLVDKRRRRTVGIRIPEHPVALALVAELGRPLLSTSAVRPGDDEACDDADDVVDAFASLLDLLVDSGPTSNLPSTVIEIIDDEIHVLREGHGELDGILE